MVVEGFDRKEINLTRERQAHDEGVHPVPVARFSETSQIGHFIFTLVYSNPLRSLSPDF
jgi:hypothetical protein